MKGRDSVEVLVVKHPIFWVVFNFLFPTLYEYLSTIQIMLEFTLKAVLQKIWNILGRNYCTYLPIVFELTFIYPKILTT